MEYKVIAFLTLSFYRYDCFGINAILLICLIKYSYEWYIQIKK